MAFSQAGFQNLAKRLFDTAGDIKVTITYNSISEGAFDPTNDVIAETSTSYTIKKALVLDYKHEAVDGVNIKSTDRLVKILVADLAVTPKLNDEIVYDGITYNIIGKAIDPANAVHTLQVRA